MSLWKRGRQYWADFTVAGRAVPKAPRHDQPAGRQAAGTEAHRRRWARRARGTRAGTEAAVGRGRRPTSRPSGCDAHRGPLSWRRNGSSSSRATSATCRLSAITAKTIADFQRDASRGRHREPHDQHGRRRAVARAQVVRSVASARGPRPQSAGTTASGRPRADRRGTQAARSTPRRRTRNGSTCTARRSWPQTRRCGPSK